MKTLNDAIAELAELLPQGQAMLYRGRTDLELIQEAIATIRDLSEGRSDLCDDCKTAVDLSDAIEELGEALDEIEALKAENADLLKEIAILKE